MKSYSGIQFIGCALYFFYLMFGINLVNAVYQFDYLQNSVSIMGDLACNNDLKIKRVGILWKKLNLQSAGYLIADKRVFKAYFIVLTNYCYKGDNSW